MKRIKSIIQRIWKQRKSEVIKPLNITRLYNSIDMPLRVFIDAIVDGNTEDIDKFRDDVMKDIESFRRMVR